MVLIKNTAGDIKKGIQGDAVYQLSYGRQMRRIRSPKSGLVSQAQKKRQQLYSRALNWRASLSHHDRLVLNRLAQSTPHRDSHGAILSWDKMALRIALAIPTVKIVE